MDEDQQQQQQQEVQKEQQEQGQNPRTGDQQEQVEAAAESLPLPNWGSASIANDQQQPHDDEGVDMRISPERDCHGPASSSEATITQPGAVRTLDGDFAGDEFAADAINYQVLLGKIDRLLERLKLDA